MLNPERVFIRHCFLQKKNPAGKETLSDHLHRHARIGPIEKDGHIIEKMLNYYIEDRRIKYWKMIREVAIDRVVRSKNPICRVYGGGLQIFRHR